MTQLSRAYAVRSNSAQEVLPENVPWHNTVPIPKFKNKDAYREWCKHPTTDYNFFSMVEGEVSTLRLGNGNKPFRIHGVVADYDCAGLSDAEVRAGIARIPATFPPRAWNRTFSGGVRAVWVFEHPVFYYSSDVWKKFIARCTKELKLTSVLAGLDDHITMPELYYCSGSDWTVNETAVLRGSLVDLWMYDACKIDHMSSKGTEVPLDIVEAEMTKKFPGRWEGDFTEGARGVRFWDETGDAKSAIVKPTGMICFTGNEPFLSWEKIFGREFVQKYIEDRRGKAVSEMHSDGTAYYRQLPNKMWDAMKVETARRHLKVVYGLSDATAKGDASSEIDALLNHLEQRKRIHGAMPFPLNPQEVVNWNGMTFLNNSLARLCPAVAEPQEWGVNFPWLSRSYSTLFLDHKNLVIFLCWLHIWLKSAHAGRPCRGQSLFIVGPPGTGKSLLSRQILARMVGGYADARDHLVDGGRFNSSLFEKALWCIDDSTVLADPKAHARFSALVKAMVANDSMQYEQKYGYSGAIPFVGRLVTTLNNDPISLGILPNTDASLLDKVIMLQTDDVEIDVAATEEERYAIIDRELPYFVRWLLDFEMPEWVERDNRFGIKAWHDKDVLAEARSGTTSYTVMQIIEMWRNDKNLNHGEDAMPMSPTELYIALASQYPDAMRGITLVGLGKHISQAMNSGACDWIKRGTTGKQSKKILLISKNQK
jgi:hypothetical protein